MNHGYDDDDELCNFLRYAWNYRHAKWGLGDWVKCYLANAHLNDVGLLTYELSKWWTAAARHIREKTGVTLIDDVVVPDEYDAVFVQQFLEDYPQQVETCEGWSDESLEEGEVPPTPPKKRARRRRSRKQWK